MLIEFNVTNYRSFLKTQTLQMTAGSSMEMREENSFAPPVSSLPRLLRSSVIYGPNASGKSNLIRALHFMKNFILTSAQGQEGHAIAASPFSFSRASLSQPSEFEVIFIAEGVRYQYGFSVSLERVEHEWLLAYPQGRVQRWFERIYDHSKKQYDWYFGSKFSGKKKVWQEATRANALFLSAAIQLNNEQLKPVFYWFHNLVVIRHHDILDPGFSTLQCQTEANRKMILQFMNIADLSIDDIKIESHDFSESELPREMPQEMKNLILKDMQDKKSIKVKFGHRIDDSEDMVWLPFEEESDGTKKLFAYAGPWLDGLEKGRVFLVDELDTSLHPLMVRFLLQLIHNSGTNKNNAQLVFTTHDTSILDQKLMRRDQIWFMEKDKNNSSSLYPLSDFKPRKEEALGKGYLQGRYGALPFIGEVNF